MFRLFSHDQERYIRYLLSKTSEPDIELELRLGDFKDRRFKANVSKEYFDFLKKELSPNNREITLVCYSDKIDNMYQIHELDKSYNIKKVYYKNKKSVEKLDIYLYGIRIAVAKDSFTNKLPNHIKSSDFNKCFR